MNQSTNTLKLRLFSALLAVFCILIIVSCSKDSDKPRTGPKPIKKQTKIVTPSINQKFALGDQITFKVSAKKDSIQIDSIALLYKDQIIKGSGLEVSINSDITGVGIPRLFLNVYLKGGKKESHIPKVIILPEAPQKYTYKVVNTYPHDPKAYTQGLYLKDGLIYESTGQNGSSTIRKVDIKTGKVIQISQTDHDSTMHLNLFEKHFSYISNFKSYAKKYQCPTCSRIMNQNCHLLRHIKKCQSEVEEIFKGGKYRNKKTLFELLDTIGIYVPEDDRYDVLFSTYDFEALQIPIEEELHGRTLHYKHEPATVSVCSSVPGHTDPIHITSTGDSQELVDNFVKELLRIPENDC